MRIARGISIVNTSKPISTAAAFDADALAYFTANTAITSTADKTAINNFYLGLKSDGIYTKIKAMYLPIWGSASASKWNLVNPLDTNAAFRLNFSNGFTYANTGVTGNGTSAYANTFLIPATALTLNQSHMSFYCRTNTLPSGIQLFGGSLKGASYNGLDSFSLGCTNSGLLFATQNAQVNATDYASYTDTSTKGFFINNRTSTTATTLKLFKNGLSQANATTSPAGQQLSPYNQYLWARYNDAVSSPFSELYANREFCFMSIGNGLTDAEASNFYTRVNTLMTYFGINV